MTVRCAKCGEELLGAVNRCWKCGQQFIARPTIEGLPPVREELAAAAAEPAVEAELVEELPGSDGGELTVAQAPVAVAIPPTVPLPLPPNPLVAPRQPAIGPRVKRAPNLAALGGTVGSLVLGTFALVLAPFRFEAAIIALMGLVMGIWGLYSPRRGWALVGMLLCCLGISIGTFTGVRALYLHLNQNAPVETEDSFAP